MTTLRVLLPALLATALLAPAIVAHHTPPGFDVVHAGDMKCDVDPEGRLVAAGSATTTTIPIVRTTDNGHLQLFANGHTGRFVDCKFEVIITGYTLFGVNPQGGLNNVVHAGCGAGAGGSCVATADADWWVNFVGPNPTSYTPQIDVHFDLVVNGMTVDSGLVSFIEPSLPQILP